MGCSSITRALLRGSARRNSVQCDGHCQFPPSEKIHERHCTTAVRSEGLETESRASTSMRSDRALDALEHALYDRGPTRRSCITVTAAGTQYTAFAFGDLSSCDSGRRETCRRGGLRVL